MLVLLISACASPSSQDLLQGKPVSLDGIQITGAFLSRRLDSDLQPVNPAVVFTPEESIYLTLRISGHPKSGNLSTRFFYGNQFIGGSSIDLTGSDDNLLRRIGQNSQAAFPLRYPQALLISPYYSVEVFINDQLVADIPFEVQPPADAIPTRVESILMAKDKDGELQPLTVDEAFDPQDMVFLIGQGDFGRLSWLQAEWYIGDDLVQQCTTYLSMTRNYNNERFLFQCALDEGWPPGTHAIVLVADDEIITREVFEVR